MELEKEKAIEPEQEEETTEQTEEEDSVADDVEGWDSFSHITLIVAIEARFNITFTQKEAMGFNNVGALIKCIERKTTV